jgi:hypothetical protein
MTRAVAVAVMMAGMLTAGLGQQVDKKKLMNPNPKSPPMETSVTVNEKQIWIVYHAPSVRGRKVFGGADALQPDNTQWRLGADWATVLHTDGDLDLNGVAVPAGDYSLFVDLDQGQWKLIVNKQTGQWGVKRGGAANFDAANNVGETAMTMSKAAAPVEQMKITLSDAGGNKGKLVVEWAEVVASAPFAVK